MLTDLENSRLLGLLKFRLLHGTRKLRLCELFASAVHCCYSCITTCALNFCHSKKNSITVEFTHVDCVICLLVMYFSHVFYRDLHRYCVSI